MDTGPFGSSRCGTSPVTSPSSKKSSLLRWSSAPELEELQEFVGTREEVMACLAIQSAHRKRHERKAEEAVRAGDNVFEVHMQLDRHGEFTVKEEPSAPKAAGDNKAQDEGNASGNTGTSAGGEVAADAPQTLTAYTYGWGRNGLVDEVEARWANMVDLPIEAKSRDAGAAVSAEEEAGVPKLREAMLRRQGLDAPPKGFQVTPQCSSISTDAM
jgi:hypothetical protein